jgi:hypothetical protein
VSTLIPSKSSLCAVLLLLALATHCEAVLTIEGATAQLANTDDFLLEAVAGREAVNASLAVQLFNPAATGDDAIEVESTFSLVEYASGLPVSLQTVPVGTTVVVTNTFTLEHGARLTLPMPAALRPAAALDSALSYRVVISARSREVGGAVWSAATVYTGAWRKWVHFTNTVADDASLNVKAYTGEALATDRQILKSVAGQETFTAAVPVVLHRYDIESLPQAAAQVPVTFQLKLVQDGTLTEVPLAVPTLTVQRSLLARQAGPPGTPLTDAWTQTLNFAPAAGGVVLPTVNYWLEVTVSAAEPDLTPIPAVPAVVTTAKNRFLVLSGALSFGGVQTIFTALGNDPSPPMLLSGGIYSTQLAVTQGTAQAAPNRRYGDGTLLDVTYDPASGNAVVTGGTQNLTTTESDIIVINTVRFVRGVIRMDFSGALLESGGILFPAGFGVSTAQHSRRHQAGLTLLQEPLDSGLWPLLGTKVFTPPSGQFYYAFGDRLPLRFRTSAIIWKMNAGTLEFTQEAAGASAAPELTRQAQEVALAGLAALPGAQNAEARASNDAFLKNITNQPKVTVSVGASGQALMTVSLNLGPGQMQTHFPQGVTLSWTDGVFHIEQNAVQPQSFLTAQSPVTISYKRDCDVGCGTLAGDGQFVFTPTNWQWKFTADGGVKADGSMLAERLRWGTTQLSGGGSPPEGGSAYAMQTSQWSAGSFHVPGSWLSGEAAPGQRPEALLLSGVLADGSFERPNSTGYSDGLGDYTGLNLRVGTPGAKTGRSVLAGITTADYDLKARSKYYVRASGVTGIHEAVALTPSTLFLYDFEVNFDGLRLAYRDGINVDSETGGSIHVDSPVTPLAGFDLAFKHMLFKCQGQPSRLQLATEGEVKTLAYWGTNIVPISAEFAQPIPAVGCAGVDDGFLLLSVSTSFPSVTTQKLHATLGFMANGNLVTKANPLSAGLEVDGRFTLPPNLEVLGAGGVPWQVTVVGSAYLNNPAPGDYGVPPLTPPGFARPAQGFLTFPATMNLPWFQDAKVQFHVSAGAGANANSVMHIMGGWPADPKKGHGKGWQENGQSYFTDKHFDRDNVGFDTQLDGTATAVTVDTYRDPPQGTENPAFLGDPYRPRAEKLWLDVVNFDFPLKWETVKRRFSSQEQRADLIVIGQVHRQVKSLTPSTTELTFGAQLAIPRINTQNLVGEVTEGLTGALANGIADAATAALPPTLLNDLMGGMGKLDQLLSERYDEVLSGPLAAEVDAMSSNIINSDPSQIPGLKTELKSRLSSMQAPVAGAVSSRLGQGMSGVGAVRSMLSTSGGKEFNLVRELVKALLQGNAGAAAVADTALAQLLPQISDDLVQADETLDRALQAMNTAQGRLGNQVFAVFQETKPALDAAGDAAIDDITLEMQKPGWGLLSVSAQQARLRRLVQERVIGSTMVPKLQLIVRQHVQDANELFRAALDDVLGQVNHLVRGVIKQAGTTLGNEIRNEAVGKLGEAGGGSEAKGKLAAIDIEGYAQINDESLRVLDINGKFEFNVPDSLSLQAHMRYQEYNTDTPEAGCRTTRGEKAATIEINAKAECNWVGAAQRTVVFIGSKFTLLNSAPVGFDGTFGFEGSVTLGPVAVKKITLTAGFGSLGSVDSTWAYLGGFGRGEYGGHEAAAGIFLGRTCDLTVLKMVDPFVEVSLSKAGWEPGNPVTGVYFYGEAWFPLNEVFGIPSTCLLTLKAGGGSGFFGFVSKANVSGQPTDRLFVGCKQAYGVEGTVLCALEARGTITLLGSVAINLPDFLTATETPKSIFEQVADPDIILGGSYIIRGDADFSLTFGYCPACMELSKHLGVTWKLPKSLSFDF